MLSAASPEVQAFLRAWHESERSRFEHSYDSLNYDYYEAKSAHDRRKYVACDHGLDEKHRSGRYLIDRATGDVYTIKAYGVPNRLLGGLSGVTADLLARAAREPQLPVEQRVPAPPPPPPPPPEPPFAPCPKADRAAVIAEATELWRSVCRRNLALHGDEGSCVLGAGLYEEGTPIRSGGWPARMLINAFDVAAAQGSLNWERGMHEVIAFLRDRGIKAAYCPGRMD